MTKAAAIQGFWESFGLAAIEENAVPTGDGKPEFPYLTYELVTDDFGHPTAMTASLWYRGESWVPANAKADEISAYIGRGGVMRPCDGGAVWIRRGSPFAQSMGDDNDNKIKRKYINITAEFVTAD